MSFFSFLRSGGRAGGAARSCPSRISVGFFGLSALFLSCFFLLSCDGGSSSQDAERVVPIRVAVAQKKEVPRILHAVGNVEAYASVHVKSQVSAQIVEVPVSAGEEVQQGDVLFRLDPRPFDAALAEAEARLVRDEALLAKADQDHARYQELVKKGAVSKESYDQMATMVKTVRADIEQAKAAIVTARLNKEYSVIRAPVSGKLGDILIRLGNVIKANDERTLVIINSIRPAEVRFTVAERHLPGILKRMNPGPLEVGVLPEGDNGPLIMGKVTAVNNEVDRTTGSIRLHAMFPNEDSRLWPGQFVRVTLVMDSIKDAVVVPDKALQEGLNGPFMFLAAPEKEGESGKGTRYRVTPVGVSTEPGPEGTVVVSSGLSPGDVVVTEGQLGLAPGALAVDIGERQQAAAQ